ncbi:MAG: hypothetical protein JST54_19500 [Deltaproteobacteria bacterium]|nr:hypothetical protein [Deltaproteobacteria bacterium]
MTAPPPRQFSGLVIRGHKKQLERMGLLEAVTEKASPELRAALERPPLSLAKINAQVSDELTALVAQLRGDEAAREMNYGTTRDTAGPMLVPMLQSLLAMFGRSPHTLFGHLGTIGATMAKNVVFTYEQKGPTNGAIRLSHDEPGNRGWFLAWEGVFRFAFDLCSVEGEVWPHEAEPDNRAALYRVRWDPK